MRLYQENIDLSSLHTGEDARYVPEDLIRDDRVVNIPSEYLNAFSVPLSPFLPCANRDHQHICISFIYPFDTKRFFALDDYYDSDRQSYYNALQSVDQKTLDITEWLKYFTYGVALQIVKVKDWILTLSGDIKKKRIKGQIALTERQMKIIEKINIQGHITNKVIREMFKLSDEGALKEISKLVRLGVLKSEGKGRSVRYVLD